MSILRVRVGWGAIATLASMASACSLLTSLNGLTGGEGHGTTGGSDGGDPAQTLDATTPTNATDAGSASEDDAPLGTGSGDDATASAPPKDGAPPVDAKPPLVCTDGGVACNGACVNIADDPMNCNGCGNVCSSGLCGNALTAPMTSLPSGWTFNGSAVYNTSAPSAELTLPAVNQQAGSFIYDHPIVVDGLDIVFQFRLGLDGGLRSDGMGFLLQTQGATAVGAAGSGLGMAGLPGYGVELDIYDNGTCGDTSNDHVGIDSLTLCNASQGTPTSLMETDVSGSIDLADTHWHTAEIALPAGGHISLSIDGTAYLTNVPLTGYVAGTRYYLGFSGGTGGLVASDGTPGGSRQEVKNVAAKFATPRCL